MNTRIKSIFVANKENRTIVCDTNLQDFVYNLQEIESEARNYQFYYRKFKKDKEFVWNDYVLQELINPDHICSKIHRGAKKNEKQ